MKDIILIGGGGHCKSVIDTIRSSNLYNVVGILDLPEHIGEVVLGVKVIGTDDELSKIFDLGVRHAFVTLGSIGNVNLRKKLTELVIEAGFEIPALVDSTAVVSKHAIVEKGTFVGKRAVLNAGVRVGRHCIINTGAILDHDTEVKDYVHVAPGSAISGNVRIGNNTHIGTNSTVIQGISIGFDCLIGAGSVVVKDISDAKRAFGNPCREVE